MSVLSPLPRGKNYRILVVDDDSTILKLLFKYLTSLSYKVEVVTTGKQAIAKLNEEYYDIVLLDLKLPDDDGISILEKIKNYDDQISVIIMTGYGKVESAVKAMKKGADDYLLKPFNSMEELAMAIRRTLDYKELKYECAFLKEQLNFSLGMNNMVGKSKKMKELFKLIHKVAPLNSTVLIQGESGTGKELVARAIHQNSNRAKGLFIALNCGAIPYNLLESELFGYEKGAFTGAETTKKGYFEFAQGGTILLDEISEMDASLQVKLLRVLQDKHFHRIGGREEIIANVRIIASTNKDLEKEVLENRFRKDLYYRINVIKINVPPLRERREDIPLLVFYFLEKYSKEFGKNITNISPRVMNTFLNYQWEGNVRELENVIEHAVAMAEKNEILPQDIPKEIFYFSTNEKISSKTIPYEDAKRQFEQNYLRRALEETGGNIAEASKITLIPRQNIYEKIKKFGIDANIYRIKK